MDVVLHIQQVLERVTPFIASHGGAIRFVSFDNGIVFVQLEGACLTCPMSFYTLQMGLLAALQAEIESVREVRAAG